MLFTLGAMLVTVTAFIVTTSVLVNVTRTDFKDFKTLVETRFSGVEGRLNRLEVDVAEIKAICRERSGRDTPV